MSTPPAPAGTAETEQLKRLRCDQALLTDRYPDLAFVIDAVRATAVAEGTLKIELPDGSVDPVEVRIEFDRSYPHTPPRPYDAAGRWPPEPDRHIEPDGHFCLFLRGVDAPDMKLDNAIVDFVAELTQFVRQQLVLDSLRKFNPEARFPGPEWPHGACAYALFVVRLLQSEPTEIRVAIWDAARTSLSRPSPCPCRSGNRYGDCHFDASKKLRRAAREGGLSRLTHEDLVQETQSYV